MGSAAIEFFRFTVGWGGQGIAGVCALGNFDFVWESTTARYAWFDIKFTRYLTALAAWFRYCGLWLEGSVSGWRRRARAPWFPAGLDRIDGAARGRLGDECPAARGGSRRRYRRSRARASRFYKERAEFRRFHRNERACRRGDRCGGRSCAGGGHPEQSRVGMEERACVCGRRRGGPCDW